MGILYSRLFTENKQNLIESENLEEQIPEEKKIPRKIAQIFPDYQPT